MNIPGNNSNENEVQYIILDHLPVAYVRPVDTNQGRHYAVCTADGTQLALFASQEAAFFAAKQHDLEPVLTH